MLEAVPGATVVRPSLMFGPEDRVLQPLRRARPHFAGAAAGRRRTHRVPAGLRGRCRAGDRGYRRRQGEGRAQPMSSAERASSPCVRSMEFTLATIERSRMLVPLPFGLAKAMASVLQFAPSFLKLTPDQVRTAQDRQCRLRGRDCRRPHAARARHRRRKPWKRSCRHTSGASAAPASSAARRREICHAWPCAGHLAY